MVDTEKLAEVSMEIISYAGTAKSKYILAYEAFKKGDTQKWEEEFKEAEASYAHAHKVHREVLFEEVETKIPQVSLLLVHAEDQLMSVETIKFLISELTEFINNGK